MHDPRLLKDLSCAQLKLVISLDPLGSGAGQSVATIVKTLCSAGISSKRAAELILSWGVRTGMKRCHRVAYECFEWYDAKFKTSYGVKYAVQIGDVEALNGRFCKKARPADFDRAASFIVRRYYVSCIYGYRDVLPAIKAYRKGCNPTRGFNIILHKAIRIGDVRVVKLCLKLLKRSLTDKEQEHLERVLIHTFEYHESCEELDWLAKHSDLTRRKKVLERFCQKTIDGLKNAKNVARHLDIELEVNHVELLLEGREAHAYDERIDLIKLLILFEPNNIEYQRYLECELSYARECAIAFRMIRKAEQYGSMINKPLTVDELEHYIHWITVNGREKDNMRQWAERRLVTRLRASLKATRA
ncbi:hypothetical protein HYV69_00165 [Candidatus Uhrbacteria bacterium]|nr:hypothetical protein [Candidatus Uhrbacteria bacterium]